MPQDIPPVPYKTPVSDQNGLLTVPWIAWFRQLFNRVGGNMGLLMINPMDRIGDMVYGASDGTATRLAGSTSTTKKFLTQTGTGSVSASPGWNTISSSDVPTITNAMMATMANNTVKGNTSGGVATPSDLSLGTVTEATSSILTLTGWSHVTLGSPTIQVTQSSGSLSGYLSSTDWNTFNNKQASGSYITALTGDATATGPGSVALTLATVNSNVGSFGSSTAIPSFTVNAKGLITAASTNAVIAPAGTLSGTTLNATVVTSSLTTVGTIGTGVWQGTTLAIGFGGTGVTSVTTSPTASSFAGWDSNKNLSSNAFIPGYTTTATASGTTTMVVGNTETQVWTGTLNQTVKLPTTSIAQGAFYRIINNSSGVVTVQSSGANTIVALAATQTGEFTANDATPTTAANWSYNIATQTAGGSGTVTSVQVAGVHGLSFAGGPVTSSGTLTAALTAPTVQRFTSGSALSYTTPTSPSPLYIEIEMCGGGGGGGGGGTPGTDGGNGSASTWIDGMTILLSAGGGSGAGNGNSLGTGAIGAGGTNSTSAGPIIIVNLAGGAGSGGSQSVQYVQGGNGGTNPFGGAGMGANGSNYPAGATDAVANSGGGGGGAGGSVAGNYCSAPGGGAAGYLKAIITSPAASYTLNVGGHGAAGANNGGNGGDGIIIVKEYYQ